jgi:hypothetical protein
MSQARRKRRNIHVVPAGFGTGYVARVARGRALHRYPLSQRAAIAQAIPEAKKRKSQVVIHRRDGRIRDADSYGNESEVKDTKH